MLTRLWQAGSALALDAVSFAAINALQLRAPVRECTRARFAAYFEPWRDASPAEYFALPADARLELGAGGGSWPSVWPTGCAANDRFHLDLFLAPDGWRAPLMLLLHGLMSVSDRGYRRWAARLNALGWSAAFVHLPYHYGRRPPGTLSGEWCLTADLVRSAEALRQMVIELRLVCRAATALGCPHVGLWGTSYGGLAAALLVLLEPAVSTAWLLEPIADVDHAFFESPATIVVRRQLARQGITRADIADYVQLVCPSFHQPLIPPARILLLAGTYDRVTPPAVIRRLHAQWGGSHYAEFPQGHVGYRLMPESLALAQRLMPELFAAR